MSRHSFIASLQGYGRSASRPSIVMMCRQVAQLHGVDIKMVFSQCRKRRHAHARQECYMRAHDAGYSLPEIGDFFDRDHTTILHGVRAAKKRGKPNVRPQFNG